jgi:Zn finger protein HypA/HybF involved in hydrogenase expression
MMRLQCAACGYLVTAEQLALQKIGPKCPKCEGGLFRVESETRPATPKVLRQTTEKE